MIRLRHITMKHELAVKDVSQPGGAFSIFETPEGELKDPLLTMTLCAPNERQDNGNLGQKRLSDNTKVDLGTTKDHG